MDDGQRIAPLSGERLDDAAHAGWLYYVAGKTQDEIARRLGVSRQTAQRLVAMAVSANLVRVRLDHPIARCKDLARRLTERFGLRQCEVTPSDPASQSTTLGVANAAAAELERWLEGQDPLVVAMGTGEEMRATAMELRRMHCPQHRLVSLVGTIARDGSATLLDAVSWAAEKVGAPHYPMPCSVQAPDKAERDAIMAMRHVRAIVDLALSADVTFFGIGSIVDDAPMVRQGHATVADMRALQAVGAAGEITGWAYDDEGRFIEGLSNDRAMGARPVYNPERLVIGVSIEPGRLRAIRAALRGRLLNGLITNDAMAERLLA